MKKSKLKDIMPFFPLTVQNAAIKDPIRWQPKIGLKAKGYQSDQVNSQQLYKPISKIIRFR